MRFDEGVDLYLDDRQRSGHITSPESVRTYRFFLDHLAEVVGNRDPSTVGHQEIKVALARWPNPNTYAQARTAINVFYRWLIREGYVKSNPVARIEAPRARRRARRRLTRSEMRAVMDACRTPRERRVIWLLACTGLRNKEIRHLAGRHFARPGFIWVSPDIAKGGRERMVPIGPDLEPVAVEIIAAVALDELVLPSLRSFNPGVNTDMRPVPNPLSPDGLIDLVAGIAERAGIAHRVTPHQLRHYFGEAVTSAKGIHTAQELLGHASIQTTQIYAGKPSLDDLADAMKEIVFRLPAQTMAVRPVPGRAPVNSSSRDLDRVHGLGRLLVALKLSFRPLVKGGLA